ncbi:MAG: sigma-54 dependent transcriptional regulator [bacterium]|nr:sigma-54 dependent transcriptional regulator [bacterium]
MGLEEFGLIGESPPMQEMERVLRRVGPTDATVLIHGESGTGKELVAGAIHKLGRGTGRPFVNVDCTNIPENLLESELFGHEAGAFTDARTRKQGLVEGAHGGTLFLDEIALLPLPLQSKLLHVLETQRFRRLGGTQEISIKVRFLAATNENLADAVDSGRFREDLYHRLAVVRIEVPPLRDRGGDVRQIASRVVAEYAERHQTGSRRLGASTSLLIIEAYHWPGNVRELRNVLERAVLMSDREVIRADDLDIDRRTYGSRADLTFKVDDGGTLRVELPEAGIDLVALEKTLIQAALARSGGNVTRAAKLLHLTRDTLRYRIEKHKM